MRSVKHSKQYGVQVAIVWVRREVHRWMISLVFCGVIQLTRRRGSFGCVFTAKRSDGESAKRVFPLRKLESLNCIATETSWKLKLFVKVLLPWCPSRFFFLFCAGWRWRSRELSPGLFRFHVWQGRDDTILNLFAHRDPRGHSSWCTVSAWSEHCAQRY